MPSLKFETSVTLSQAQEQAIALEITTLAAQLLNTSNAIPAPYPAAAPASLPDIRCALL